jgi:thiol-disulfide isomerase/thioredoxin
MRPPVDDIPIPLFPRSVPWINSEPLRAEQEVGHPVLVEFWDFCRPNSIRTLPYMKAWHERYRDDGLRVIGIHAAGFPPSAHADAVEAAAVRLEVPYPVVVDAELEIWELYGNLGWPARYLFDQSGRLFDYHYGEGGYDETELAIQELLGVQRRLVAPIRPTDEPGAPLAIQSDDVAGAYSGPYEAGGVWAVLEGQGTVTANGRELRVDHPGCYELIAHDRSTAAVLDLAISDGVTCHAVCFTTGLAEQATV